MVVSSFYIDKLNIFSFFKLIKIIFDEKIFFKKKYVFFFKKKNNFSYRVFHLIFVFLNFSRIEFFEIRKAENLKDKGGLNWGWKIQCYETHDFIKECIVFFKIKYKNYHHSFEDFLSKKMSDAVWPSYDKDLIDILLCINEINYHKENNNAFFIQEKLIFNEVFQQYASKFKINIQSYNNQGFFKSFALYVYEFINLFKKIIKIILIKHLNSSQKEFRFIKKFHNNIAINLSFSIFKPNEFIDNTILDKNKIIYINDEVFIGDVEINFIKKLKLNYCNFYKFTKKNKNNFDYFSDKIFVYFNFNLFDSFEKKFIKKSFSQFNFTKKLWFDFFKKFNIKIYLTSECLSASSIAPMQAIKDFGGLGVSFQSSFWEKVPLHGAIFSDIFFSFSPNAKKINLNSNSKFKYIIKSGFIKDYSFKNVKKKSYALKSSLLNQGAIKIFGFFDQGEVKGAQTSLWNGVYSNFSTSAYVFMLEKLINNKWMGLIIKPKKPALLKKKLGKYWCLLEEAIKTKRCYVVLSSHPGHTKNFDETPSFVSMASDICIHDTMISATAGLEAYLNNTPTIFNDNFGFKESIFFKDKKNLLAFDSYETMWKLINENWQKPIKGFGDWSSIIDQIDPYRDGKASIRINQFMKFFIDNFDVNEDRAISLEEAIKEYGKIWGVEHIFKNE